MNDGRPPPKNFDFYILPWERCGLVCLEKWIKIRVLGGCSHEYSENQKAIIEWC